MTQDEIISIAKEAGPISQPHRAIAAWNMRAPHQQEQA